MISFNELVERFWRWQLRRMIDKRSQKRVRAPFAVLQYDSLTYHCYMIYAFRESLTMAFWSHAQTIKILRSYNEVRRYQGRKTPPPPKLA